LYTSPLVRARQTARILARRTGDSAVVRVARWMEPDTAVADTIRALAALKTQRVAVVGHMPHLGSLVQALTGGARGKPVALKKAGVCCIEFPAAPAAGAGVLLWLMQPRHLAAVARGET
jgi:phosphohistidine phosphatase